MGKFLICWLFFSFSLGFRPDILGNLGIVLLNFTETYCLNVVLFQLAGNLSQPDSYIAIRNFQAARPNSVI